MRALSRTELAGVALAGTALVMMLAVAVPAGAAAPADAPLQPAAAPSSDGKALFARRCGICHFADGGGTWMLERRLGKAQSLLESRTDLQATYVRIIARRGLNGMPRFTRVELPDADLEAIAAYLTRSGPRP